MIIYIIAGAIALIGAFVSRRLKSKFDEYSKLTLQSGLSGKEIAERMLADEELRM